MPTTILLERDTNRRIQVVLPVKSVTSPLFTLIIISALGTPEDCPSYHVTVTLSHTMANCRVLT